MSIIAATTGIALANRAGLKLPKINLGLGKNAKKIAKDKIKMQMKQLGVKESSIQGFSWRNANAGKELLEFFIANPLSISSYNANPISDIGGQSVKEWIDWYRRTNPSSGSRGGSAKPTTPVAIQSSGSGMNPKIAAYVLGGLLLIYGYSQLVMKK